MALCEYCEEENIYDECMKLREELKTCKSFHAVAVKEMTMTKTLPTAIATILTSFIVGVNMEPFIGMTVMSIGVIAFAVLLIINGFAKTEQKKEEEIKEYNFGSAEEEHF